MLPAQCQTKTYRFLTDLGCCGIRQVALVKSAVFCRQTAPPQCQPVGIRRRHSQTAAGSCHEPHVKALCPSLCSSCWLKGVYVSRSRRGHSKRDQTGDRRSFASIQPSCCNERHFCAHCCLSVDVHTCLCAGESQCANDLECCWNAHS